MKTEGKYILKDKKPVPEPDLMKWAEWMEESPLKKSVGLDEFGNIKVSTIFLGLDHNFGRGRPLLYETMIFGGIHDMYQTRYHTWEQAEVGHRIALKLAKSGKWPHNIAIHYFK